MILVIDNYDSFTYNLVQYLGELGAEVVVKRNDAVSVDDIRGLEPSGVLISPGPGRPEEAGVSLDVIAKLGAEMPIFGVCLGHQSIAQRFGASVVRADRLMHGRTSEILHEGQGVFDGLPSPLTATRYHSLIVKRDR
jgi:para-aminobenzoate synthetase component 2